MPSVALWWREIVRFYRQRSRVVGVIASPLLFWLVIGSGFGTSFRSSGGGGQHYLDYFFPGVLPGTATDIPTDLIAGWTTIYEPAVVKAAFAGDVRGVESLAPVG